MEKPPTRLKIKLLALGCIILGFLLMLFAGEAALRWIRPDLIPANQLRSVADADIGWRFESSQKKDGWDEEGQVRHIKINSLGFSDIEHPVEPPSVVHRIAFLGDSFTAAVGIDFEKSFVRVTERSLNESSPGRYETLNFGQPGFGTASEFLTWKHVASKFKPNTVILAFFIGNDIANQLPGYPQSGAIAKCFQIQNGIIEELPASPVKTPSQPEAQRGIFYRTFMAPSVLYQRYKLLERDLRVATGLRHSTKKGPSSIDFWKRPGAPVEWQTYLRQPGTEFEKAWELTEGLILKLDQDVRGSKAEFHVILIPGIEALDPKSFDIARSRYPELRDFSFDPEYPRNRLIRFLETHKIQHLDLTNALSERVREAGISQVYFPFDQHFNTAGHALAGRLIAEHLRSKP